MRSLCLPPAIFMPRGRYGVARFPDSLTLTQPANLAGGDCSSSCRYGCAHNDIDDLLRWRPADMTLLYSTFLGGSGNDSANSIAVDTSGGIYLAGSTASPNFPLLNPIQSTLGGGTCQTVAGWQITACLRRCLRRRSAPMGKCSSTRPCSAVTVATVPMQSRWIRPGTLISPALPTLRIFRRSAPYSPILAVVVNAIPSIL